MLSLVLMLALLLTPLGTAAAWALSLPWQQAGTRPMPAPAGSQGPDGLQEVPPPAAVQQLQAALADREPVVEILSPRNDAVLSSGPWTLRLAVRDWPLVDAGDLGLGPHLVVQLDQEPPRIWTDLEGELPELSPGSHRLTVYAALPWGEARRNPGAVRQIRLHRTAPNPLGVPEVGSPQLLAVSPPAVAGEEPLLFDFLLLDAPLQNIGGAGTQWRLRLTINGDDLLLDQQIPLWLRGWKPGVNALKLELLDARGNPLNPPFNALVREVDRSDPPPRPRWRGGELNDLELGRLLGRIPAPPPAITVPPGPGDSRPTPAPLPQRPQDTAAPPREEAAADSSDAAVPPTPAAAPRMGSPATLPRPAPAAEGPVQPSTAQEKPADGDAPGSAEPQAGAVTAEPQPMPGGPEGNSPEVPAPAAAMTQQAQGGSAAAALRAAPPGPEPTGTPNPSSTDRTERPASMDQPAAEPEEPSPAAPEASAAAGRATEHPDGDTPGMPQAPVPDPTTPDEATPRLRTATTENGNARALPLAETSPPAAVDAPLSDTAGGSGDARITPGSSLSGRARDLVNEDGTLRRPERRGPLAALREKLQA